MPGPRTLTGATDQRSIGADTMGASQARSQRGSLADAARPELRDRWYRRPMMRLVPVFVLALVACSSDPIPSDVLGSPSDLRTAPGTYAGYRVSYPCSGSWVNVGVEGVGANPVTTLADITRVGADILAALADVPSVFGGGGYGVQCHTGVGTGVDLDDWRDVDRVIARIGELLGERDLSLQVGISVSGIPVAAHD